MTSPKTIVELRNRYGDVLCELEPDGYGYWKLPKDADLTLAPGDELTVTKRGADE